MTSSPPRSNNSYPLMSLNSTENDSELQRVIIPNSSPQKEKEGILNSHHDIRTIELSSKKKAKQDKSVKNVMRPEKIKRNANGRKGS